MVVRPFAPLGWLQFGMVDGFKSESRPAWRALAVTTATRSDALSDIPTLAEFVPGYEASQWYGVGAPKDTPAEVIDKLNKELNAAFVDPRTKARIAEVGGTPLPGSPGDFGRFIAKEVEKWDKVVEFSGVKIKAE